MNYTLLQSYFLYEVPSIYYKCPKNRSCDEISSLHYCKLGTYVYNVSTRLFYTSGLGVHYGKQVQTKYFQSTHFRETHAHLHARHAKKEHTTWTCSTPGWSSSSPAAFNTSYNWAPDHVALPIAAGPQDSPFTGFTCTVYITWVSDTNFQTSTKQPN